VSLVILTSRCFLGAVLCYGELNESNYTEYCGTLETCQTLCTEEFPPPLGSNAEQAVPGRLNAGKTTWEGGVVEVCHAARSR